MGAVDEKILSRVQRLLALAAPDSGATQYERESAAIEAVRLITTHKIPVGQPERIVYRDRTSAQSRRREPPPPGPTTMRTPFGAEYHVRYHPMASRDWRRGVASRKATCADENCNGTIQPGERVWERERGGQIEYLHADGPCRW